MLGENLERQDRVSGVGGRFRFTYAYGCFTLLYGRNQYSTVKQLSFN